jgi:hypothetical protein
VTPLEEARRFSEAFEQIMAILHECVDRLNASLKETDYQVWAMNERLIDEAAERLGL